MKVALCFHGHLRQFEITYKNIIKKLSLDNHEYDVYIYTSEKNYLKNYISYSNLNVKNDHIDTSKEKIKKICKENLKKLSYSNNDIEYLDIYQDLYSNLQNKYKKIIETNTSMHQKTKNNMTDLINFTREKREYYLEYQPFMCRNIDQFLRLHLCCKNINKDDYDIFINLRCDALLIEDINLKDIYESNENIFWSKGIDFFFMSKKEGFDVIKNFVFSYGTYLEDCELNNSFWHAPEQQISLYMKDFTYKDLNLRPYYLYQLPKEIIRKVLDELEEISRNTFNLSILKISQPCLFKKII